MNKAQHFLIWILLLSTLFATRPFRGLFHDAILYAAQTLHQLGENNLNRDIFFTFGNQDDFSLFTTLYAPVVSWLGLPLANVAVYTLGLLAWFASLAFLASYLFRSRKAFFLALAAALTLSAGYGNGILSYGEGFVTPRIFAEAAGLMAISFCLQSKHGLTALFTALSLFIHPLIGLGFFAFVVWLLLEKFRVYMLLVALGLATIAALGLWRISPFYWILEPVDAVWFDQIVQHDPIVLAAQWGPNGFATLAVKGLVVWLAFKLGYGVKQRLAKAALVTSAVLVSISFIGADLLGNRLIIGLQLWRVLLLLSLVANLFAFYTVSLLKPGPGRNLLIITLVSNALEIVLQSSTTISGALAVIAGLTLFMERHPGITNHRYYRWLLRGIVFLIGFVLFTLATTRLANAHFLLSLTIYGTIIVSGWWITRSPHPIGYALAFVVVLGAFVTIDKRSQWQRYVENGEPPDQKISALIDGKTVYWEDGLELLWFKFRQPQFYSCRQRGGMVFFKAQADEFKKRAEILAVLRSSDFSEDTSSRCPTQSAKDKSPQSSTARFRSVCRALPELDIIVLKTHKKGLEFLTWRPKINRTAKNETAKQSANRPAFFFYTCDDFRS